MWQVTLEIILRLISYLERVSLGPLVIVDDIGFQLVELELGEEDIVRNVVRSSESSTSLQVREDSLETWTVPVEEQLSPVDVVEAKSSNAVAE